MEREENKDVEEEFSDDELEELEEELEEDNSEKKEDDILDSMDLNEDYGSPMPEEKHNAHAIIDKALAIKDTTRTTYLTESELGRPVFSVRFLSDLEDDAIRLKLDRLIAYYHEKIQNITGSGMSNKGFIMNLNVTQKRDQVRRRVKDNSSNLKEGKK